MEKNELKQMVRNILLVELAKAGVKNVPVAVSNRHVHLSRCDVEKLFGAGYQLRPQKALSQPHQYACEEKIVLTGPKGKIADVRVLGPERKETQVEVSMTDSFKLGVKPVVRMSGDLSGTPGIRLSGPAGEVELSSGVIFPRGIFTWQARKQPPTVSKTAKPSAFEKKVYALRYMKT